ncbi:hypothetical protein H4Q26_002225 [Puccinia striiformis f. sp. tritici PST-130]|nr:hypothetical protein H4Q26_002225 [Puccinia striiformis f. sp. tritici PST-130]
MPRGRKARPSQPLIEDLSPLSEARSALLSPGTTSVSPTGTQSLLPGTTPGSISTSFTTPGNTQNPVPIPSTQQSPTPNPGGQFPSQLTQETGNNFPELYVAAVQSGKRSDGGFKIDVHRSIARDLSAEFPGIPFTGEKLRSKCNQCFKKWYDAFLACKDASGFGWNEQHNMVTASEEVWEAFLRSHPAARRFKNTSFPSTTSCLSSLVEQMGTNATDRFSGDDENDRSGAKGTTSGSQPAGVRPRRRHRLSSGDRFENSIERLITAFASTSEPVPEVSSRVEQAIAKFQDDFAEGLTMEDLVAGFSILESESKAKTFLAIRNEVHAMAWMRRQIEIYNSSHNV